MLQPAGRLRLAVKALEQVRILSHAFDDGLECHQSIDNGIARAVDNAHSSATQLLDEFVFAELIHRAGTSPRGAKVQPDPLWSLPATEAEVGIRPGLARSRR